MDQFIREVLVHSCCQPGQRTCPVHLSRFRVELRHGIMHRPQAAELLLHDLYQVIRLKRQSWSQEEIYSRCEHCSWWEGRHVKEGECRNGSYLLKGWIPPVLGMCHSYCVLWHAWTAGVLQDLRSWDEDVLGEVNAVPSWAGQVLFRFFGVRGRKKHMPSVRLSLYIAYFFPLPWRRLSAVFAAEQRAEREQSCLLWVLKWFAGMPPLSPRTAEDAHSGDRTPRMFSEGSRISF